MDEYLDLLVYLSDLEVLDEWKRSGTFPHIKKRWSQRRKDQVINIRPVSSSSSTGNRARGNSAHTRTYLENGVIQESIIKDNGAYTEKVKYEAVPVNIKQVWGSPGKQGRGKERKYGGKGVIGNRGGV